jgi:hypothetical protein
MHNELGLHLIINDRLRSNVTALEYCAGKSHVSSHIPVRHHRTKPTSPDEVFGDSRTNPTKSHQSDRLLRPHNPSVVGSIPTGPTSVLCQDIGDAVSRHSRHGVSGWLLIVAFGVNEEPSHQYSFGIQNADVTIGNQHRHDLTGVLAPHAEVQHA